MKVTLNIVLNENILDPQGDAIKNALLQLNFSEVNSVRQGKLIELHLNIENKEKAVEIARKMAEDLLVNSTMETYRIEVE
tara:strand:- start:68 stop:307 length:240 start_codon:yes stop_codon:yes gene_type:complete